MTKQAQTHKTKSPNPKKLSKSEYRQYCDFILDQADGVCQYCNQAAIAEFHHTKFGRYGADKDDRSIIGVCLQCHLDLHANRDKNRLAAVQVHDNWDNFCLCYNIKKCDELR